MTKYRNQERLDREEAELAELEAQFKGETTPEPKNPLAPQPDLPVVDKEEETWKKRHSDLRSYTSKQINELSKEIENLKQTVKEKEREATKLPTNKAEAEDWVKNYPDLARVLSTLIETQTEHIKDDVKASRQELEIERLAMARERAINQILKVHPEFKILINEQNFIDWVEKQPLPKAEGGRGRIGQAIYDALYHNNDDAEAAIEAVDTYKADLALKNPRNTAVREAATSVRKTSPASPADNTGKKSFSESEIQRMSGRDYERLEEEIDQAKREGRFVYDMTGAAR